MTKSRGILVRRNWSAAEDELLRRHYADSATADIAAALGRKVHQVYAHAYQLGLEKSAEYLASPAAGRLDGKRGAACRFVKGAPSWNKGLHYQPGGRVAEGQFKKGQLNGRAAQLFVPVGSYRINNDGYLDQKLNDTPGPQNVRWFSVHRLVWEKANGPIPDDHVVVFRPGRRTTDPALITLDALELISRVDLMKRNSVHAKYPPELARLVHLRGVLNRQINRRVKEAEPA